MSKHYKYFAGFYAGTRFCVCIKSNDDEPIRTQANEQNYELRQKLPAITMNGKRINPEYKVLREITNQLELKCS